MVTDLQNMREENAMLTRDFERLLNRVIQGISPIHEVMDAYHKCKQQQEYYMKAYSQELAILNFYKEEYFKEKQ